MSELNYSPIRMRTLKANHYIPFNLYIYFKNQYVLFLNDGGLIEPDKYKKLKKQKIAKFFIKEVDEDKYQSFLDDLLEQTLNSSDASTEDKVDIVEGQATNALEKLKENPTSESSFDLTREAAQNIQRLLKEDPKALQTMYGDSSGDNEAIVKHSLNVAALSIQLAKKLKVSDENIDYLTTAALMHDVGLMQMSPEKQKLFIKNRKEFTNEERKDYYFHCTDIVDHLQDKPYINAEILELIYNHEEKINGNGPLKKSKLTLAQQVLSLVNTYDKKIIVEGKTPQETVKAMMIDELGNYDLSHIKMLKTVITESL